jgi:hypothetical protein
VGVRGKHTARRTTCKVVRCDGSIEQSSNTDLSPDLSIGCLVRYLTIPYQVLQFRNTGCDQKMLQHAYSVVNFKGWKEAPMNHFVVTSPNLRLRTNKIDGEA